MSVNAIGPSYQNQTTLPTATVGTEQEKPDGIAEINKLSAEIKQAESELKETTKEVRRAAAKSIGGGSEKVQLLQNKLQTQQQEILSKQMKIKEIESTAKPGVERLADTVAPPRMDRYVAEEDTSGQPDNVYHQELKDGTRTIVFNRPER